MQKRIRYIGSLYAMLPCLYIVIALIAAIAQMVRLCVDIREQLEPYMHISNVVGVSIGQVALNNLILVHTSQPNCPGGYGRLNIGSWPGNFAGCYNRNNDTLLEGSCFSMNLDTEKEGWNEVPAYHDIPLYAWGSYFFCAQYIGYGSVDSNTSTCPIGSRKCSKGNLCVPDNMGCPITAISFQWMENGRDVAVTTIRNPDDNAILYIATSRQGMPCSNPAKSPLPKSGSTYPLDIVIPEGCDQFGVETDYAKEIDREPLFQFYSENNLGYMYQQLPQYADYIGRSTISLYSKSKIDIRITPGCANAGQVLTDIIINIRDFNFVTDVTTALTAEIFILLIFACIMAFYFCANKEGEERFRFLKEQKFLIQGFHFMAYIVCVMFIFEYSQTPKDGGPNAVSILQSADVLIQNECFADNKYGSMFIELRNSVQEIIQYYLEIGKIMSVISYTTFASLLVLRGLRGYYRDEVEEFEDDYIDKKFDLNRSQQGLELAEAAAREEPSPNVPEGHDPDYEEEGGHHYVQYTE